MTGSHERAWEIAKAYDRLGNAVTNGHSKDLISSRAYVAQQEGKRWGCILCKLLNKIDDKHCEKSPVTVEVQPKV